MADQEKNYQIFGMETLLPTRYPLHDATSRNPIGEVERLLRKRNVAI